MLNSGLRRLFCILTGLLVSLPLLAGELTPFSADRSGRLFTIKGSNTVGANLVPSVVADYLAARGLVNIQRKELAKKNEYRISGYPASNSNRPPLYIDVFAHGSSTGFAGLQDGSADLGMSSRRIKSEEAAALSHLGDMRSFAAEKVLAIDGLAIIVHSDNPVVALTSSQVAGLFSGAISNWQDVGAGDMPVSVYARDLKSGTWDTFKNLVLRKSASLSTAARRFESNDKLSAMVAADPGAIGFTSLASINRAKALAISDTGTNPLQPSTTTVATEDYLLSRRLYLYQAVYGAASEVEEFVHFAQSNTGQAIAGEVGFVSQTPIEVRPVLAGIDETDYLELVDGARRLSVNIRFEAGSASLDNKALQDVRRLAQLMQRPGYNKQQLFLIGFGDHKQAQKRALVMSKLRATAVKIALFEHEVSTAPVAGFGAIMPLTGTDRVRNQRVEVWIR